METNDDIELLDLEAIQANLSSEDAAERDEESLHASASAFMVT